MGANEATDKVFSYFNNIFSEKNSNSNELLNKINFTKLFTYGLIADYDSDYKVLLSHAGGIGSFLFHTKEYYDNIIKKFTPYDNNILTYFNNIEVARRELMRKPSEDVTYKIDIENNVNNVSKLKEIISIINSPLKEFLLDKSMSNPYFYLLQALGLKPDNVGVDMFVSFIQSCDCILCKGPLNNNIKNTNGKTLYNNDYYTLFLKQLEKLDIKFVSFGHNPICAPVPLIYRRPENPNIIFIANDVSNGYRPANIESIDKIPLSYIEKSDKDKFNVGVGVFKSNMLNSNISNLPESLSSFKPMIKKWELNKVPEFNKTNKIIKYNNNNILTFPARISEKNPFLPVKFSKKNNKNKNK
jgi:hypothetical protein